MKHPSLTSENLIAFIQKSGAVTKSQIADAFGIKGDIRLALKDLLKTLEQSGQLIKMPGQEYAVPTGLPEILPVRVMDITFDGDIVATPDTWDAERQGPAPRLVIESNSTEHGQIAPDDRLLVRAKKNPDDDDYTGKIIRRIMADVTSIVGEIVKTKDGYAVRTLQKRQTDEYDIKTGDLNGAGLHDLVQAELTTARGGTTPLARVTAVIGPAGDPRVLSLMAAHENGLRTEFPEAVLKETAKLARPTLQDQRHDLRKIPLVTIDGEDARDFDDAVFAEPDTDPDNKGGYHLVVAIADVSYYVRAGTELDNEAYKRGNSTYFPDRVLPMLPEALSNDLCSLKPKEDRYCLAFHLWINKDGLMIKHQLVRGLMRSIARLTYTQVQRAYDGQTDDVTEPLLRPLIYPLYDAFKLLQKARGQRGTLDLDVPERKILVDGTGAMCGVAIRERFAAHQLIEEFMVLANVAAALALQKKKAPCVYRVHDSPSFEKTENLRTYLATFGLEIPGRSIDEPGQLAAVIKQAKGQPFAPLVSESMLRSQMQAHYATENIGHFGLALNHYAHFTSPIRRYADLLVHRSLISAYSLGPGGLVDEQRIKLGAMCDHISITERASMQAERSTVDRFTAVFLADRVGAEFDATIAGVTRFGLFVRLKDTGADGLIPMRGLGEDFFIHDERRHALIGRRSGVVYRLGAPIRVELIEVAPLAGALMFRPVHDHGADIKGYELTVTPGGDRSRDRGRGGPPRGRERSSGPPRGGRGKGPVKKGGRR